MNMNIIKVKEYWNKRPCNIKHSNKPIGSKEYFDDVEEKKYFVEPHIKEFVDFIKWNNKKVLEIGCGIGTDSISFLKNGAKLTIVELSDVSLNITKDRLKVFNYSADIYNINAEELSKHIKVKPYDLVYSFGVIHHSPNPEKILEEMSLYMGKDTIGKVMVYAKYSWKAFEFFIKHGYKFNFNYNKTIKYYAEAQLDCPIAFVYSKKDIKKLFNDFTILEIKKDHIFPYVIKDYIAGKYNKKLLFKFLPKKLFKYLESILGWHYLITFKLKK